jgi:hypothetical protein
MLRMEWFWQTSVPFTFGGESALMLGPVAQLLFLCAHLTLHHQGGEGEPTLLWLQDVAEVVAFYRDRIDWDDLLRRTRAYQLVLSMQRVLTRVAQEWHAPVPVSVLVRLQTLRPSRGEEAVVARLAERDSSSSQRLRTDLETLPGWRARLRFAWRNLLPPFGYVQHCYRVPSPLLVPLYYAYRWFLALRSIL